MVGVGAFTENFRSALNGYNRTDVVQFIQRQTIEHEKAMRLLREENARLKQAAAEPGDKGGDRQAEIDELNRRIVALTQQNSELRVQNKTLSDEKEALESTLETTRLSLAAAEEAALAAVSQPPKAVPTLDRPIAPPMGLVSPPGGFDELELAAYRRAERVEREANERANAIYRHLHNALQDRVKNCHMYVLLFQ